MRDFGLNKSEKTLDKDANWDADGTLGNDEDFAQVTSDFTIEEIQDSWGLKPVSIRMQKSVLDDLKLIAAHNGTGYQPLIKLILKRFVDAEIRRILRDQIPNKVNECSSDDPDEDPLQASA